MLQSQTLSPYPKKHKFKSKAKGKNMKAIQWTDRAFSKCLEEFRNAINIQCIEVNKILTSKRWVYWAMPMYGVRFFSWVNLSGGGKNGGGSRGAKRAKRLGGKNCVISRKLDCTADLTALE